MCIVIMKEVHLVLKKIIDYLLYTTFTERKKSFGPRLDNEVKSSADFIWIHANTQTRELAYGSMFLWPGEKVQVKKVVFSLNITVNWHDTENNLEKMSCIINILDSFLMSAKHQLNMDSCCLTRTKRLKWKKSSFR